MIIQIKQKKEQKTQTLLPFHVIKKIDLILRRKKSIGKQGFNQS